jgi:hypothetical protein
MYLPTDDPIERLSITKAFGDYRGACSAKLWDRFDAQEHWAKIEVPGRANAEAHAACVAATAGANAGVTATTTTTTTTTNNSNDDGDVDDTAAPTDKATTDKANKAQLAIVRSRLAARYPLKKFEAARRFLDPKEILSNSHITKLLLPLEE